MHFTAEGAASSSSENARVRWSEALRRGNDSAQLMKAEHLSGGGVAVLVAGAVRMEAVDREVLASSLPEIRYVRWRREVDEEDVVARGCGREDL